MTMKTMRRLLEAVRTLPQAQRLRTRRTCRKHGHIWQTSNVCRWCGKWKPIPGGIFTKVRRKRS